MVSRRRVASVFALAFAATACAGPASQHLAGTVFRSGTIPPLPSQRALTQITARTQRVTGPRIPILLYHRVAVVASGMSTPLMVDPALFSDQMDAIARSGAMTLTISQMVDAARKNTVFHQGAIAITFDDATEDQYLNAFPVLERNHLRATFYVPTGRIGQAGYLSWPQIEQMQASGLVEFGAHTITHRDLMKMSGAEAWRAG
jgi:hypothetical protein